MKIRLNRKQRRAIKREKRRGKNLDAFDTSWNDVEVARACKDILQRDPEREFDVINPTTGLTEMEEAKKLIEWVEKCSGDPLHALTGKNPLDDTEPDPEYGIFSHPEPGVNPFSDSERGEGGISHERESYSFDERPIINGIAGVPDRRMYQSAAYVSAGRKLRVGLIEKKPKKTVIWLSIWEHRIVLDYVKGRSK